MNSALEFRAVDILFCAKGGRRAHAAAIPTCPPDRSSAASFVATPLQANARPAPIIVTLA